MTGYAIAAALGAIAVIASLFGWSRINRGRRSLADEAAELAKRERKHIREIERLETEKLAREVAEEIDALTPEARDNLSPADAIEWIEGRGRRGPEAS